MRDLDKRWPVPVDARRVERIIAVLTAKLRGFSHEGYTEDEWREFVVGTVCADTVLILTGVIDLDQLEADLAEQEA